MIFCRLKHSPPLNNPDQHDDNGNHQQDVNKPSHRVTAHQPQQPQNYQYHSDRPQHLILLSCLNEGPKSAEHRSKLLGRRVRLGLFQVKLVEIRPSLDLIPLAFGLILVHVILHSGLRFGFLHTFDDDLDAAVVGAPLR